jgi:cysteinyl-tRNA synthetase
MFPHHENEIAQSICASGKNFVNYWLHSEFLLVDGGKMSKSLGNFYTMKDLKERSFSAESIRFQLLSGHYRTKISFSLSKKLESDKVVQRINDFYKILANKRASNERGNSLPDIYFEFVDAMNDDLNTPKALAVFFTWMKNQMKLLKTESIKADDIESAWNFMNIFNDIFDFIKEDKLELPVKVKKLLQLRKIARIEKDWILSDDLRNKISKEGWLIEDTPNGQVIKKL